MDGVGGLAGRIFDLYLTPKEVYRARCMDKFVAGPEFTIVRLRQRRYNPKFIGLSRVFSHFGIQERLRRRRVVLPNLELSQCNRKERVDPAPAVLTTAQKYSR